MQPERRSVVHTIPLASVLCGHHTGHLMSCADRWGFYRLGTELAGFSMRAAFSFRDITEPSPQPPAAAARTRDPIARA
jgi:hypothetical protein